ncbi:MAG: hypothetical protein ABIO32_04555 [Ferruginibacter sp.]
MAFIVASFLFTSCKSHKPSVTLLQIKEVNYPSGSGLSFYKNKIYLIGDDAAQLWVMDTALNVSDSIRVHDSATHRIAWQVKHDYEDIANVRIGRSQFFFMAGSGSGGAYRNAALLINAETHEEKKYALDTFYTRLKMFGLKDINIEGSAELPAGMLLSNRGNKGYQKNYLVFTDRNFWAHPDSCDFTIILVGTTKDSSNFNGISGLEYAQKSDKLLLSVSTENTYSNLADGAIGKSYLWIINDISNKKNYSAINPNLIIDLEAADARFKGHKIEAVTILQENKKSMVLLFISDDDDGKSILFKVRLDL